MITACPHCKKKLTIEDRLAGQPGRCPACQQVFTIPAASGEPPRPAVPAAPAPPRPTPPPATPQSAAPPLSRQATSARGEGPSEAPARPRSAPPPLPAGPRGGGGAVPAAMPAAAAGPPALSPAGGDAYSALNRMMSTLARAFSIQKLGFFLLGGAVTVLIVGLIVWVAIKVAEDGSPGASLAFRLIAFATGIGLFGVIAGGVAHQTHMEGQGRSAGMVGALGFCGRRFFSLFGGVLLLLLVIGLAVGIVNGVVSLVYEVPSVGKVMAALLLLPQVVANLVLVVTLLVCVLLPCIVAVDSVGAFAALSRLVRQLRERFAGLMVQLGLSVCCALFLLVVVGVLTYAAMIPTGITNASSTSFFDLSDVFDVSELLGGSSSEADFESAFGSGLRSGRSRELERLLGGTRGSDRTSQAKEWTGDSLRAFFTALVWLAVFAFPLVYWIVSFTEYYRGARGPLVSAPRPRARARI